MLRDDGNFDACLLTGVQEEQHSFHFLPSQIRTSYYNCLFGLNQILFEYLCIVSMIIDGIDYLFSRYYI